MASSSGLATATQLIERADIHKSCKAIETLVNLLNDYCETTSLLCGIQKKLFKALKETAGIKGTAEVCANAFGSSASVLESIAEVDSKFSKIIDKECETISADTRKWFKKLAKEEKAHDDRLNNANEKIKQAGQSYERAAKRKNSAAVEEHNRYMNLISSLGPEIAQSKHEHTSFVTQRHIKLLLGVAATMARVSDAEWLRQCERIRRAAGLIGEVAQWRVYCEGEWGGRPPPNLRDIDQPSPETSITGMSSSSREGSGETNLTAPDQYYQARSSPGRSQSQTPLPQQPHHPHQPIRKVSPLPSPSTPTPGLKSGPPSSTDIRADLSVEKPHSDFDPSTVTSLDGPGFNTLTASFPAPPSELPSGPTSSERGSKLRKSSLVAMNITPTKPSSITPSNTGSGNTIPLERTESANDSGGSASKGSRVAAMRDKYDKSPTSPTSPSAPVILPSTDVVEEKDKKPNVHFRRTSVNVADLASRYEPLDRRSSMSPTPQSGSRQAFPTMLSGSIEQLPVTIEPAEIKEREKEEPAATDDENQPTIRASERDRRMQELRQIAYEEQERQLSEQRRRLEEEARILQEEKRRIQSFRESDSEEQPIRPPRSPYGRPGHAQSYTHLSTASNSSAGIGQQMPIVSPTSKQPQKLVSPRKPRLSLTSSSTTSLINSTANPIPTTPGHALDCNCVSCVLHRPPDAPNPLHLRTPKSEKKSFFRRLSMEVGNTFSLSDGGRKRSNSNLNLQAAMHASTLSSSSPGYFGVGSGIGNDSGYHGGKYVRGVPGSAPNEVGVLSRNDYAYPSRR